MKVFIIAEAGVNHNGSMKLAKKLIDVAVESGADAVKFQTFKAENLVSKNTEKAEYQKKTTTASESQFDMIKKLELDIETHKELITYCLEKEIMFLSTPFDHDSINLLGDLGLEIFKIPSGEITNLPYLRHIGSLKKQVILSTGMSTLQEVEDALNILISTGTLRADITVLHANTMYPTPMDDVNLNAMLTMQIEFDVAIGYSDHTLGIEVDIAAVAMGATIIEKHFTLDRNDGGVDSVFSLEPNELKSLVVETERAYHSLGGVFYASTQGEEKSKIFRRSLYIVKDMNAGDIFTKDNLKIMRPGMGLAPKHYENILGRKIKRSVKKGTAVNWEIFE